VSAGGPASGEAFGDFYCGSGYTGTYEVPVEFAQDDYADGSLDAGDTEDG